MRFCSGDSDAHLTPATAYAQTLAPIIFGTMRPMTIKTIVILLIASSASGQTSIRGTTTITSNGITSDTINSSPNRDFQNRINLGPIDSSEYDFEIRFYKLTAARNTRNLRIVRFAHGEWVALEFEEKTKSKIQRHVLVSTLGFDTFLTNLTKHNFATLPNQSDVDKKIQDSFGSKKEYWQSRPIIMDGYDFTIEFKIDGKFRVYQFSNPDSYLKGYKNVEEFKNYSSIQKLFEQDLVRK